MAHVPEWFYQYFLATPPALTALGLLLVVTLNVRSREWARLGFNGLTAVIMSAAAWHMFVQAKAVNAHFAATTSSDNWTTSNAMHTVLGYPDPYPTPPALPHVSVDLGILIATAAVLLMNYGMYLWTSNTVRWFNLTFVGTAFVAMLTYLFYEIWLIDIDAVSLVLAHTILLGISFAVLLGGLLISYDRWDDQRLERKLRRMYHQPLPASEIS